MQIVSQVPAKLISYRATHRCRAGLSNSRRRRNVADAFRARENMAGRRVLLVDDVMTTGATASACAAALKRAGARSVALLALARVDRRLGAERPPEHATDHRREDAVHEAEDLDQDEDGDRDRDQDQDAGHQHPAEPPAPAGVVARARERRRAAGHGSSVSAGGGWGRGGLC